MRFTQQSNRILPYDQYNNQGELLDKSIYLYRCCNAEDGCAWSSTTNPHWCCFRARNQELSITKSSDSTHMPTAVPTSARVMKNIQEGFSKIVILAFL